MEPLNTPAVARDACTVSADAVPLPDGALMRAVVEGNEAAFREIFDRHASAIHSYLCARVGGDMAEDLLAETFAMAWKSRTHFRAEMGELRPWLYGIATRVLARHREAERRWQRSVQTGIQLLEVQYELESDRKPDPQVMTAIALLPDLEREVLVLVALGELSVSEAARAAGITPVAARMRLHRARKKMYSLLPSYRKDSHVQ